MMRAASASSAHSMEMGLPCIAESAVAAASVVEQCGDSADTLLLVQRSQTDPRRPAHEEHHATLVWLGLRSATEFAPARSAPDEANARLLSLTAP
jgi:hypothetical protein